ncbi:helix-turn-helix domain-containing protein [Methylobacterium sp. E-065]|uniref:winged helix-turn-helix transcriptional regulator n=2 Tax=Methylobacterium TaxID=407 RepID=UPI0028BF5658|nr:helix-turn-helix domain-containing protein [Methylobacterium sp. E-065]
MAAMKDTVTGCSVEHAMHLLGGRWRLLLVSFLIDGPKRFNELKRVLPGISQRMLTLDLRALETAGLVSRTVHPTTPVRVEYALTEDGMRLKTVVAAMQEFGLWLKQHRPALGSSSGLRDSPSTNSTRSFDRRSAG